MKHLKINNFQTCFANFLIKINLYLYRLKPNALEDAALGNIFSSLSKQHKNYVV